MRLTAGLILFVVCAAAASPEKPRVGTDLVTAMAQRLDSRLSRLSPDDPVQPVGLTQGAYLPGIGVVFMGSVNLAPVAGITPFHQTISRQEMTRIHQKKAERIPKLKDMMQDVLSNMAWSMDPVPQEEQIAIAVSLFYFSNEDTSGLPSQIVMRAQKKALITKQAGAVKVDEFLSMRLGEILIERRLITQEDLDRALELQKERGDKLGKTLVDLGFIAMRDVLAALSDQLGLALVSIDGPPAASAETETLSPRFLRQFRVLPFGREDHTLTLAMADPLDFETLSSVRNCTGLRVIPVLAPEQEILDAIDKYYGESAKTDMDADADSAQASEDLEHLRDMASEAPVIRLVNAIVAQAVEKRASDIHIEPFEKEFRVRFRVDGVLYNQESPPREMKAAMISRVKLMAKLNIAERRLPQDGRIKVKTLGREVDLRVSTLPTLYGESVVMRLLDRSATDFYDLQKLGFDDHMLSRMEFYTSLPHGIFLVTGPTGSGKSTTLYSALKRINQSDKKIITIEDPVEYQMDGINQIHVNPQIGLTFASGLRHIVRQDPDVIMVGEIRDRETADIAIRSSLTGHFVYSTLHTNDAPSAITRLTDMGVENYLITSSLVSVLAQRLVRVICKHCKRSDGLRIAPDGQQVQSYRGAGCEQCFGSGYSGRVGIFELMEINDEMRRMIMKNADASDITSAARKNGMRSLREDGWMKVAMGVSTADEVMRVTQEF